LADNVVDDVEHVCSNRTSLELTAQQQGDRDFIRATIGSILCGKQPPRAGDRPVIFSPFGLGILDLALAHLAYRLADEQSAGTIIGDFLPTAWTARQH
jgi:ornithine cyclodeaminase/alanine dehydrogenase-like protein (mu-crystallin family)